jgi:hypothetical protein
MLIIKFDDTLNRIYFSFIFYNLGFIYTFHKEKMKVFLYIFLSCCISFLVLYIIAFFSPEFVEDENGNLVPKSKTSKSKK